MLNEALRYRELGYSVIPLRPENKEPLIPWEEFATRRASPEEIESWFAKTPTANIGIVTGNVSGLAVVDCDGPEGLETLDQMGLSSPMVSLTGKGKQLFFKAPTAKLMNAVRIKPGIDLRGERGYVCAPPSIHPNGKRYTWLLGPVKDLPEFPVDILQAAEKTSCTVKDVSLGWVADSLQNLAAGNRNDTFARVVGKLHHSGLDKAAIWSLLLPHAKSCGFTDKELNGVIQSITKYPTEVSAECSASSAEQFLSDSIPVAWLCNPICARGSIGYAAGLPESYKTWLLMDLAIECARGGGLWLGLFPVMGGRVLFIDQERSRSETQRRFNSLLTGKTLVPADLKSTLFIRSGTTTRLDLDDSYNAFKREVAEIRPDLILVDSFASFHTSDENDRMTIQKVLERIKEIRTEVGCAFIFIDHENKSAYSDNQDGVVPTAFRMVGSVGKIAAAESVLTIRRYDPTTCAVYHTKSTLGPRVPAFMVHVDDIPGGGIRVWGQGGK